MRHPTTILTAFAAVAALGLAGCDVRKTQEGDVSLPKYEVNKTQEGNVNLPKYDVTAPEVDVKAKQVEVEVPKVVTEKETINVPTIDIKTGEEKAREEGKK